MIAKLIGIRKLLLTVFIFLVSCAFLLLHIISDQVWKDLNVIVIPAYLTANLIEHWMGNKAFKASSTSLTPPSGKIE